MPVDVYDETVQLLRRAIDSARLGNDERLAAIRRLDREARRFERVVEGGEDFGTLIARERRRSPAYGGRTVFEGPRKGQLTLDFGA